MFHIIGVQSRVVNLLECSAPKSLVQGCDCDWWHMCDSADFRAPWNSVSVLGYPGLLMNGGSRALCIPTGCITCSTRQPAFWRS